VDDLAGISEANRRQLAILHRRTSGLVDAREAADLLGLERRQAAKLLAHWAAQGWVRRLRRGLYLLVPLEATSPQDWREDSWLVAARLFSPGYIAGWSACEHWGLTEQVFRDVAVFTTARIRERRLAVGATTFILRQVAPSRLFGLQVVWREAVKVHVSDPTRTLIDVLDDPRWAGGIRHVARILDAYLASKHCNEQLVIEYLARLGNAAAAKRLGYLWELAKGADAPLLARLQPMLTAGYALLDPAVAPRGPFLARWKLRLNVVVTHR
jgi:predicted transcriptional regulator of viral defense system